MSEPSLQYRLARYLKNRPGERVFKGFLEELAKEKTGALGDTAGRRLRVLHEATCSPGAEAKTPEHVEAVRLAEGGKFRVEQIGKSNFYYYEPPATRQVREYVMVDGRMKETIKTVST